MQNYLISKMEQKSTGQANLIVVCHGGSQSELESDLPLSEGKIQKANGAILSAYISFVISVFFQLEKLM